MEAVRITGVGRRSCTGPADLRTAGWRRVETGPPRGRPEARARVGAGAQRPGRSSFRPGSRPSPRGGRRGKWRQEARVRAEAWTAWPGDVGPCAFPEERSPPSSRDPKLPPRGVLTSAPDRLDCSESAWLR